MSFRDFTFPAVIEKLGLSFQTEDVFRDVPSVSPRAAFVDTIHEGAELSQGLNNEKARSEFVIAPVLMELRRMFPRKFGLFSGTELNVDAANGLSGVCDFMISRVPMEYILKAPIVTIAEAKNDNVWNGYGQCIAAMHAAVLFNAKAGAPTPVVYGISTTGTQWKFLRLAESVVALDRADYFITQPERLLGVLSRMIEIVLA